MENKNSTNVGIIVLVFILAIVLGLLGGYLIFNHIGNKEEGPGVNNQGQTGNNESVNYSLDDAKKLMSKYVTSLHGNDVCGEYYISDLLDENAKNYLALSQINTTEYLTCDEALKGDTDGNRIDCGSLWKPEVYRYQDVLNRKKELFGDNSTLSKQTINGSYSSYYEYFKDENAFVYTGTLGGGSCGEYEYSVYDYKVDNNILYIYTLGRFDIDSSDVEEIRHKYTFKKQDSGYYMTAVEEIK